MDSDGWMLGKFLKEVIFDGVKVGFFWMFTYPYFGGEEMIQFEAYMF